MSEDFKKYKFFSEAFPNQFRTPAGAIVWTLVYLADLALVFLCAHLMGISFLAAINKTVLAIYLAIAFVLFIVESFLYNLIKQ